MTHEESAEYLILMELFRTLTNSGDQLVSLSRTAEATKLRQLRDDLVPRIHALGKLNKTKEDKL